jgi:hypothetical protein
MIHTGDNLNEVKKQFWQQYFVETLSVYEMVPHTAKVRRLEENRNFWKGILYGDGKDSR